MGFANDTLQGVAFLRPSTVRVVFVNVNLGVFSAFLFTCHQWMNANYVRVSRITTLENKYLAWSTSGNVFVDCDLIHRTSTSFCQLQFLEVPGGETRGKRSVVFDVMVIEFWTRYNPNGMPLRTKEAQVLKKMNDQKPDCSTTHRPNTLSSPHMAMRHRMISEI